MIGNHYHGQPSLRCNFSKPQTVISPSGVILVQIDQDAQVILRDNILCFNIAAPYYVYLIAKLNQNTDDDICNKLIGLDEHNTL
jgi:hypothetical protein